MSEREHVEANVRALGLRAERLAKRHRVKQGRGRKAKGRDGEVEWATFLREKWGVAFATRGHGTDQVHSLDGIHFEVKRVELLNVSKALLGQAVHDAHGKIPVLAHRRNREVRLISLRAEDALMFAAALLQHTENKIDAAAADRAYEAGGFVGLAEALKGPR